MVIRLPCAMNPTLATFVLIIILLLLARTTEAEASERAKRRHEQERIRHQQAFRAFVEKSLIDLTAEREAKKKTDSDIGGAGNWS